MFLSSSYQDLGKVVLPEWSGRQYYMHTFCPERPVMAEGFEDYLDIVMGLVAAAGVKAGEAHMTVDEKVVQPQMSQRRPGAHVDGRFLAEQNHWTHNPPTGPGPPVWAHYCNNVPMDRMAVIVAASVSGCIVYPGKFTGEPKNDGDLEHIRDQFGEAHLLPAGRAFLLSPDCVHESKVFTKPTKRSFLRIAYAGK